MANLVIPKTIASAINKTATFNAVYTKPAGSDSATVFVGATGSNLSTVSKSVATATLSNGLLHVSLGAGAASRSAAGLASEDIASRAGLAHGIAAVTSISHG